MALQKIKTERDPKHGVVVAESLPKYSECIDEMGETVDEVLAFWQKRADEMKSYLRTEFSDMTCEEDDYGSFRTIGIRKATAEEEAEFLADEAYRAKMEHEKEEHQFQLLKAKLGK